MSSTFVYYVKQLDMYRSIPTEALEEDASFKTSGPAGIISILCALLLALLVVSETITYLSVDVRHHMTLDRSLLTQHEDGNQYHTMSINFNVTLPRIPCACKEIISCDHSKTLPLT